MPERIPGVEPRRSPRSARARRRLFAACVPTRYERPRAARDGEAMSDPRVRAADLLALTMLVALVLWWPLVAPPIGTHGEAREGLVVQDVVRQGHWVLPRRNGALPSKPPLFHWIAAGAAHVAGLSDAVVRFPSALAAWLVLALVYGLGVAFGGRASGWLAVGALAGVHGFFEAASEARVDMLFAAGVTLTLVAFLAWYRSDGRWARAASYAGIAAAVLTKGPAGAVLPGLVIVVFLARERRLARLAAFWSWPLAAAVLLVDVGWYALATHAGGREFLERQILHENFDRFVGHGVFGMHGGRSRLTMLASLATDLVPWNLVLVWAAVRWWRGEREDTIGRFVHTWWIVILAFFTIAYGKRGIYLLPLYPAIALLAGRALAEAVSGLEAQSVPDAPPPTGIRRFLPSTRAARLLVASIVALDLGVVLIGQIVRVHKAGRSSLVPFAREVDARVGRSASLVADAWLDESDLLVLAYRLERPIPRLAEGVECVPGAHRLATPRPGRPLVSPLLVSKRRGVPVALVLDSDTSCPLALEHGNDR
jgi:hypothetical protein